MLLCRVTAPRADECDFAELFEARLLQDPLSRGSEAAAEAAQHAGQQTLSRRSQGR